MMQYLFNLPKYLIRLWYIPFNLCKIKISGANIGCNCKIYQGFNILIKRGGKCNIGDNFVMQSGSYFNPLVRCLKSSIYIGSEGDLKVGDNTGFSAACIWCVNSITIGNYVDIGANCIIMDNDAHNLDYRIRRNSSKDVAKSAPIVIGDDVLIGTGSIILKGVTIGARSIIGAGSVVTKSIPADCIAAGNPCRVIKYLDKNE